MVACTVLFLRTSTTAMKCLLLCFTCILIYNPIFSQNNNWLAGNWVGETNIQLTERPTKLLCNLIVDSVEGNDFSGVITVQTSFDTSYTIQTRINSTLVNEGFNVNRMHIDTISNAPRNNWQTCSDCNNVQRSIYLKDDKVCIEFNTQNCNPFCNGILRFYRYIADFNDAAKRSMRKAFAYNPQTGKRTFSPNDSLITGIHNEPMGDSTTLPGILKRNTQFIKKIITHSAFITIGIYDDMQIDGDVVTVYHNRDTVAYRQRLSATAIHYNITASAEHPFHRITMVADNLGSIPPNTSVLVVTTKEKEYRLKIESTMQRNVGVEIDYVP